jgi:DNA-binding LacI/PurR family transcriptional regulator
MATLYDVAKLAGVSPKTVSRVFNESHLVTGETRNRVNEAIRELDYHPNAIAASLKKQRTNTIGFVVPYGSSFVFQDPNMMEQLRGAHDQLTQEGYEVIVSAPIYQKDALEEISRLVKHRNVDGVILYPAAGVDRIIGEFNTKNFYYVTLGTCFEGQKTNFVDLSVTPGAYFGTRHLVSQGHRYIGLVNKPRSFFMIGKDDLLSGYQTALQESGLSFNANLIREGDYSFESGYHAFKFLKEQNPEMTAALCASDPMAYGVIRAIQDAGLIVNRDIEVISGDNLPLTQKLFPFISSISNPAYEQGKLAGRMIISIIQTGSESPGITLKTEFVVRGSHM